ncbi:MAG: hypothetical protein WA118_08370 [Carboxydocellales bacterium]
MVPYLTDLREKIEITEGVFLEVDIDIERSNQVSKDQVYNALQTIFDDILKRFEV